MISLPPCQPDRYVGNIYRANIAICTRYTIFFKSLKSVAVNNIFQNELWSISFLVEIENILTLPVTGSWELKEGCVSESISPVQTHQREKFWPLLLPLVNYPQLYIHPPIFCPFKFDLSWQDSFIKWGIGCKQDKIQDRSLFSFSEHLLSYPFMTWCGSNLT